MVAITVSEKDVTDADAYLAAYLQEKIPEADFSPGSVVRDFVVKAIAHIFAFFRAEIRSSRDQQSLLALQRLPASTEVDEAVEALLSNLFITRRDGVRARVVATIHFSNAADVLVLPSTRFYRGNTIFTIDSTENLLITAGQLTQVLLVSGAAEYTTQVALICSAAGAAGNIAPGRFSAVDRFSSFFSYAENVDYGTGGKNVETTDDLLVRTPTALAVRNLANVRSVQSVLLEDFPELTDVLTTGFGDPEMTRDRASEGVTRIDMHVGGHMDVHVKLPTYAMTEASYVVGATATRADGVINVFEDGTASFLSGTAVVPGDVLKISAGIPGAPREFIITTVEATRLYVSERAPFPEVATAVPYSVGAQAPAFSEKRLSGTGNVTNKVQTANAIYLTGRPHGKIRKLEIQTAPNVWVSLNRVNLETVGTGEYSVSVINPSYFQSEKAVERINLPSGYTGNTVRVTFDTLAGFEAISARVTDSFERNVCANNLVRGFLPVYVGVYGTYALRAGGTRIDEDALNQTLATFLHDWPVGKPLDVSSITSYLRDQYPDINRFYDPVTIFFTVYAPDGQLYQFQTTDVVAVFPDGQANVTLRGEGSLPLRDDVLLAGLRFPDNQTAFTASLLALRGIFSELGVTNRNIRFLPDVESFNIEQYVD